jgi:hypothetical protein
MTSIAAGDGAQLGPVAENLGRRRASGIYGAIITAAILDTLEVHATTTVLVISVVVTLLGVLDRRGVRRGSERAHSRRSAAELTYILGALAATWPMFSASFAPLLAVVLATLACCSSTSLALPNLPVLRSSGAAARRRVRRSPRRALALGGPARRARAVPAAPCH